MSEWMKAGKPVSAGMGYFMKKSVKNTILILLLITLGVSTVSLAYLHFFAADDKNLSGLWTARLDVTEQAAVTALGWLQEIEAVSLTLEEMESYMQNLTIEVNLTLEQSSRSQGIFQSSVLKESYDACRQEAYEAFAGAFRALLTERLRMAGYTGSTEDEALEALVTETFGMSTVSYLMSCGPALLPSLEELQALYEGSGTYEIAEGILYREFDGDGAAAARRAERYIRKGTELILLEEMEKEDVDLTGHFFEQYPMVYTLKRDE